MPVSSWGLPVLLVLFPFSQGSLKTTWAPWMCRGPSGCLSVQAPPKCHREKERQSESERESYLGHQSQLVDKHKKEHTVKRQQLINHTSHLKHENKLLLILCCRLPLGPDVSVFWIFHLHCSALTSAVAPVTENWQTTISLLFGETVSIILYYSLLSSYNRNICLLYNNLNLMQS